MTGLTLDAGALIAFERGDRMVTALLTRAKIRGDVLSVPAGVVAQVWRDGKKQARLARLLSWTAIEIETLDDHGARAAGQLCGATKTSDVVDATVVLCAKARGQPVLSSDSGDLLRLDPRLTIVPV